MYIVVIRQAVPGIIESHTTFDCAQCKNSDKCKMAGYKNCSFYEYLKPDFRICYLVPYFTTKKPHLVQIHLNCQESCNKDRAFDIINNAKQKFMLREK